MLSVRDAHKLVEEHLGDSSRARHSAFVGHAMRHLAVGVGADAVLWEVVGLCHDLDYVATANDRAAHGLVAAQWLSGKLPTEALTAVAAHDHRTGVVSDDPIARALRLADALALVVDALGGEAASVFASADGSAILEQRFWDRPYVPRIMLEASEGLGISLNALAEICRTAPAAS